MKVKDAIRLLMDMPLEVKLYFQLGESVYLAEEIVTQEIAEPEGDAMGVVVG